MIVTEYSASEDTTCRCDYDRGYSFLSQPKHITYCIPSKEDCSCYRKQCPDGHMLNAGTCSIFYLYYIVNYYTLRAK